MFTGIVTGRGTVVRIEPMPSDPALPADGAAGSEATEGSVRLHLEAGEIIADLPPGGSLAVDGVCLTATHDLPGAADGAEAAAAASHPGPSDDSGTSGTFVADVMGETLRLTTLGGLQPGDAVNLERCTRADGRLDGHVVQGHVDAVGTILQRTDHGRWETLRIGVPAQIAPLLARKGAIAVDGVSLTVTAVSPAAASASAADPRSDAGQHWFEIGLIPATLEATGLGAKHPGMQVNLETDVMAKYAARLSSFRDAPAPWSEPTAADAPSTPDADGLAETPAEGLTRQPSAPEEIPLDSVAEAIEQFRRGAPVVVVDDADRENEGDLIYAAVHATPELTGFTIRWSSGVLCAPMSGDRADALGLPPMTTINEDAKGTAYTVTCDARDGVTTGISAADRATTARVLASPASSPRDLTRPGHMLPLRAVPGGVLARRGHTEAAVELCRLAGLSEVGVIAELVHDDGSMQRLPALREFATEHGLALISIEDLVRHLESGSGAQPAGAAAGEGRS